jgi:hypothetical protein
MTSQLPAIIENGEVLSRRSPLETRILLNQLVGVGDKIYRRLVPEVLGDEIPSKLADAVGEIIVREHRVAIGERRAPKRESDPVGEIMELIFKHNPAVSQEDCQEVAALLYVGMYQLRFNARPPQAITE